MNNGLIDTVTEQIDRISSMADIAKIEYGIFCSHLGLVGIVKTVDKHVEPLPDVTTDVEIDETHEVPEIPKLYSITFCSITNSVDDMCFLITVCSDDDTQERLERELYYATTTMCSPNVFTKYLLEHDDDQYQINEVCVLHYNTLLEYTTKRRELTDSLPNCINGATETAKRDQIKYELSQIKIQCPCGAHVLKYSMPKHILSLRHKNAMKGSVVKPLL